jgi:ABC-type branched-subunit amino acid transport system substrate-binding protein
MRRALCVLLLLAQLALLACAGMPGGGAPASPEEQRAYDAAVAQLSRNRAAGRAALVKFLQTWPDAALADAAHLRLGDAALADGDSAAAQREFQAVLAHSPRSLEADLARLRLARLELARGDAAAARETLARVRLSRLEAADRADAYRLLADAAKDGVARVVWLAKLRAETPDRAAAEAIDAEIEVALARLSEPELARLGKELGDDPPAASVALARAERALDAGDVDTAREALQRAESLPRPPGADERLAAIRERLAGQEAAKAQGAPLPGFAEAAAKGLPDTRAARGAIGVVLPLSGPYAPFGQESLRGVLLAAGVFGGLRGDDPPPLRVVVRDSQGQPAVAAAAVRELASDAEISAIVGPLLSGECEAAAAAAQEQGIPLLALTAREEIARDRNWVFRLRTRPAEETALLAEQARAKGAQRFAILYRDDAYGRGLRSLFWDAVEARGGRVVGVASYPPGTKDFTDPIQRLVGYTLLDEGERQQIAKREALLKKARRLPPAEALALSAEAKAITRPDGGPLPPIIDFDALFVPESSDGVVLIASHLAFQEVVGVQLLGPDGWYDRDLARLGGPHIQGAIFVSHFFPDSPTPYVHEFAQHYRDTFASEPAVFAAQSYDAANLALVQLARRHGTRDAVRSGILATAGYPGVAGVLSFGPDGNARKRPFLLQVVDGKIVQLSE